MAGRVLPALFWHCMWLRRLWNIPQHAVPPSVRVRVHATAGMLTILATDDVPGLQIHLDGAWHDVAPVAGAFIINLGDMLERCACCCMLALVHACTDSGVC